MNLLEQRRKLLQSPAIQLPFDLIAPPCFCLISSGNLNSSFPVSIEVIRCTKPFKAWNSSRYETVGAGLYYQVQGIGKRRQDHRHKTNLARTASPAGAT